MLEKLVKLDMTYSYNVPVPASTGPSNIHGNMPGYKNDMNMKENAILSYTNIQEADSHKSSRHSKQNYISTEM